MNIGYKIDRLLVIGELPYVNVGMHTAVLPKYCKLNVESSSLVIHACKCNSIILRPSPRPYPGANQGPSAHNDNSHPRSIVTHRSTKATALAEQGELLLQGLRASDVTD